MIQKLSKKILISILMVMITLTSFANCFGKFAVIRKLHGGIESVNVGTGYVPKVIRTLIMYVLYIFPIVLGICGFLDIVIFNLIEFWTDNNPVGYNEYDKDGMYVKTFSKDNTTVKLTYLNFGQRLNIESQNGSEFSSIVLLRSEPGKLFKEENGKLKEIEISSKEVGDKTILKLATEGKLESSKIVNTTDLNEIKSTLQTNF